MHHRDEDRVRSERAPDVVLNVVERRAVFSARPHVRQPLGSFGERPRKTTSIGAGHDDRALVAKRFLDNLEKSLSRLQRRPLEFFLGDELLDQRMRDPDQDERRLVFWVAQAIGRQRHGNRDAG